MSNPTAPIHGNYHAYYAKRPSVKDPRIALLPSDFFLGKTVLDVGCNEGWVTCEIAQLHGAHQVVGVDIDDTLVRAAWKRRRALWSTQARFPVNTAEEAGQPKSRKRKRTSSKPNAESPQQGYFPAAFEHMFGPLSIPSATQEQKHRFPHNIAFRTADWIAQSIPEDAEGYDAVIAFSITKWIHLNGGDDAVKKLFRRVHEVMKPGGYFVLEPQAWNTYAKAKRMDERLKTNYQQLMLRPEGFGSLLEEIGFVPGGNLGTTGEGGFHRPVQLYKKI